MSDERVIKNNGKFEQGDLADYWVTYTIAERKNLLELMLKDHFGVCYQIPNTKSYIAPQLLGATTPNYNWNSQTALKFRYQYPFMPKGLIARLMVLLNEMIAAENGVSLVWKKGVVIEKDNCQAQIIQKNTRENDEVIDIEISGDNRNQKFVLKMVCDEIECIHKKSFEHIPHSKMIPCICSMCKNNESPNYHKYETLLKYYEANEKEIICDESIKKVNVLILLEGVFDTAKMRQIEKQKGHGRFVVEGSEEFIDKMTNRTTINQTHNGSGSNIGHDKIENNQLLAKANEKIDIKTVEREPLDDIEELKSMLEYGEIGDVLEVLEKKTTGDNTFVLIKTRLQQCKMKHRKKVITDEDFEVETQRITEGLLEVIAEW
jgi:internalin A